jgi:hypothetical protein
MQVRFFERYRAFKPGGVGEIPDPVAALLIRRKICVQVSEIETTARNANDDNIERRKGKPCKSTN